MKNNIKPYHLLGFIGLLFFFSSFFLPNYNLDVHIFDTYYVSTLPYAVRNMGGLLLALFTISIFLKAYLYSKLLSWIHAGVTILAFAFGSLFLGKATLSYQPGFSNWTSFEANNNSIVVVILVFLTAQVLLLINFLIGIYKARLGS